MQIYSSLEEFPKPPAGCVVTVGNFDGVHLGHQAIITEARAIARRESLPLIGITFEPLPLAVLFPEKAPRTITPLNIKIRLLEQAGLEGLLVIPAAESLLSLSAEDFVRDILIGALAARHIVEGPTFNFGRGRQGGVATLKNLADKYHYTVHVVPPRALALDDSQGWQSHPVERRETPAGPARLPSQIAISSTLIRELITSGQLAPARQALGRWFEIEGRIVTGLGIGRKLGFPTANLQLAQKNQLVPGDGVYAAWARLGETFDDVWNNPTRHPAAVTIGRSPTFENTPWQVEAHLIDYPPDGPAFYKKLILLAPVEQIRPLEKFQSMELLHNAIADDCRAIKNILSRL
jgi:riboflavin kinase / FMN adenylyltransferase